ncbi:peptidylprolyl isomerase [Noviherbaspirillum soli]|uniref:peptidylprolyl isomerase n=1 Tax=Noviherbaspirillum soli TaxID=1064518 RepID=UPI001E4357AE|nr:peptidylprolyl isomerase [Noviherbaspirillum soli]
MKTDITSRSLLPSLRVKRIMPALLCALLAAPPSWAQALKAPGAGAGPRLGGAAASPAPAAQLPPASAPAPASTSASQRVRPIDAIVAVVNNEVITAQELETRMQTVEARLRSQGGTVPPRAQFQQQLLERMIVDRAQLQLAKENGLRVDDALLDAAVARIAEQNNVTLAEMRRKVESDGVSFARFREDIRNEILLQRLREREVDSKVQITESEVDNFLASGGGATQAAQPEINLAQILVRIPENASAEQIAQRRARAEEALQQLRTGADFGQIAAAYSDASDALKGGEMGWRTLDRLPQLFVDAVADRRDNELVVVKSANGFHILRVLGRRTSTPAKAGASVPAVTQTHARHILIKVNQVVPANEARRKLVELKERLDNKAATFPELARMYSNDGSASKGGDLGWLYPGDTVPEFERAMNALQPGQISEPVESPFGFHLIQVIERKTDDVTQERQRMMARQALRERKIEEATEDWLRQLRDRTYVEYRAEELGAATGPAR